MLSDKKKEAFRMTSRFLKEIGLYDLWLKYLYQPKTHKSWLDEKDEDFSESDVLGCTTFTDYVYEHKPEFETNGYLMYDLLQCYIAASKDPSRTCYPVAIDNKKKKIILFHH